MLQQDVLHMRGSIELVLNGPMGEEVLRWKENTVVTVGRVWILRQLESVDIVTSQTISFIEIGSSTIAPTTADTALGAAVTRRAISSFDTSGLTANPPFWQAQVSYATNEGNTTLAEAGMFNSSASGTMIAHATYASFIKATSNTLSISWNLSN